MPARPLYPNIRYDCFAGETVLGMRRYFSVIIYCSIRDFSIRITGNASVVEAERRIDPARFMRPARYSAASRSWQQTGRSACLKQRLAGGCTWPGSPVKLHIKSSEQTSWLGQERGRRPARETSFPGQHFLGYLLSGPSSSPGPHCFPVLSSSRRVAVTLLSFTNCRRMLNNLC